MRKQEGMHASIYTKIIHNAIDVESNSTQLPFNNSIQTLEISFNSFTLNVETSFPVTVIQVQDIYMHKVFQEKTEISLV